jgi:hypothetical protein
MRQSGKQKWITSSDNQLQQAAFSEALGRASMLSDMQISAEFASAQEHLKNIPKKSYR